MRTPKELSRTVLECLLRNQFCDAAFSAIGYLFLGEAMARDSKLSDPALYAQNVDNRPVTLCQTHVYTLSIAALHSNAFETVDVLCTTLHDIVNDQNYKVVWGSILISIRLDENDYYSIDLIYQTVVN